MKPFLPNNRVLYVDDEPNLLAAFSSLLRSESCLVTTLNSPLAVEETLRAAGPFAVVVSDQRMPGMDGVAVLEMARSVHPESLRILMTGYTDHGDTVRAINTGGIRHYVQKPWDDHSLRALIREGVRMFNLERQNAHLVEDLQEKNEAVRELLQGTVAGTTRVLGELVSHVNSDAAAQVERVRQLGRALVEMIPDLTPTERWEALRAFDLFNLGIAVLPSWILVLLSKNGLSSLERFPLARNHHLHAAEMVAKIPRFEGVARVIRLQGKDFDGSGEPAEESVRGPELPIGARILHILLDLDRISTERFRGRPALEQMAKSSGKYDPALMRLLLNGKGGVRERKKESIDFFTGLRPGMVLLDDLNNRGGQVLLRRGMVLTEEILSMLARWSANDGIVFPVLVAHEGI